MQDSPPPAARPATPPSASPASAHGQLFGGSPGHVQPALTPSPASSAPSGRTTSRSTSMSMSLHHLGIIMSPLASPLRRQVSFSARDPSEGTRDDSDDDHDDDSGSGTEDINSYEESLAEDSKDVLIDRLNDLVRHLTGAASSPSTHGPAGTSLSASSHAYLHDDHVISALHSRVDEMESVLAAAQAATATSRQNQRHRRQRNGGLRTPKMMSRESTQTSVDGVADRPQRGLLDSAHIVAELSMPLPLLVESASLTDVSHGGVEPELTDKEKGDGDLLEDPFQGDFIGGPVQDDPTQTAAPTQEEPTPTTPPANARQLSVACDELADDLSGVLASLTKQTRDAEVIQRTLLDQLVDAEERTAMLEAHLEALAAAAADQQEAHASEVSFLRLQLRGIEVRYRAYVPADVDPELAESIENWKADWAALQAKLAEERKQEAEESQRFGGDNPDPMHSRLSQHSHNLSVLDDSLVLGHRYDTAHHSKNNSRSFARTRSSSVLSGG